MSPVQEKHEMILQRLGECLAGDGFGRSGRNFYRTFKEAGIRWNIGSQKHRRSNASWINFTFNVAAEWKRRSAAYEDWIPRATWYTGVGNRIGFLLPKREDTWWTIEEETSVETLSDQINEAVSRSVLPFLRQFQTEQEIKDHLRACEHGEMRGNYIHTITMLELDLLEKKAKPEIERRIQSIRLLGKAQLVDKAVTEATLQRVLEACGYGHPLPAPRR